MDSFRHDDGAGLHCAMHDAMLLWHESAKRDDRAALAALPPRMARAPWIAAVVLLLPLPLLVLLEVLLPLLDVVRLLRHEPRASGMT